MSSQQINLTENQREILRARLTLDLKPATDIAKIIGVSRSSLVLTLDGKRSLSEDALNKLMAYFGLVDWDPNPGVAHYLRVGADVEPLRLLVNVLFESAKLYYVKPFGRLKLDEPWTGFFVFQYDSRLNGQGLLLVHRDKLRSGKGVIGIRPELAKPIIPKLFGNVAWAEKPELLLGDDIMKQLEAPFYRKGEPMDLSELDRLLSTESAPTWLAVREAGEEAGMTPEDVLSLIAAAAQQ